MLFSTPNSPTLQVAIQIDIIKIFKLHPKIEIDLMQIAMYTLSKMLATTTFKVREVKLTANNHQTYLISVQITITQSHLT